MQALAGSQGTWRDEPDVPSLRETVTSSILATFQRRRPDASANSRDLPTFVKRLEESLFKIAGSKEEYGDLATLEARLQSVARRFAMASRNAAAAAAGAQQPGGAAGADTASQQQQQQQQAPPQQQPPQQQQQYLPGMVPIGSSMPMAGIEGPGAGGVKLEGGVKQEPNAGPMDPSGGVKQEGGGSMVPMDPTGAGGMGGYGGMPQQQPMSGGMMPTPGMGAPPGMMPVPGMGPTSMAMMSPQLMSNGAPVLRKDQWAGGGGGMMPIGGAGNGMMVTSMAMPGQYGMAPPGMMPVGQGPQGFGPNATGGMMGGAGGMVPVGGPQMGGMVPMGGMGNGMGGMGPGGPMGGMPGMMPAPGGGFPPSMGPGQPMGPGGPLMGPGDPMAAAGSGAGPGQQQQQVQGRTQYIQKQQRWLLFLRHCAKCTQTEQECQFSRSCRVGKELWQHILQCTDTKCTYPRCVSSKDLLKHHQKCQNPSCPICTPVKEYVRRSRTNSGSGSAMGPYEPAGPMFPPMAFPGADPSQQQQQAAQQQAQVQAQQQYNLQQQQQAQYAQQQQFVAQQQAQYAAQQQAQFAAQQQQLAVQQQRQQQQMFAAQQQQQQQQRMAMVGQKRPLNGMDPSAPMQPGMGPGAYPPGAAPLHPGAPAEEPKPKRSRQDEMALLARNTGTSLLETFDMGLLRNHVKAVRDEVARAAGKGGAGSSAAAAFQDPKDVCTVCRQSKFTFEPPCLYCMQCGQRIRRGQTYYSTPVEYEIKGFWCHGCYSEHKGDRIPFDGSQTGYVRKSEVLKRKNDEEIEEYWVQCDCCEGWVHQICGLFNKGRNNANSTYLCPDCLQRGFTENLRQRIETRPQSMLEAADLPQCALSAAIQARLERQLAADRARRAAQAGLPIEAVPAVEGLTVRVINNVMKKCEVRPKFLEAFGRAPGAYPDAFPYRQRVMLLYQRMDGVDVALFCMYVQEYGADCPPPNRNVVYLSYLDSVKYFRPDGNAAVASGGQSLRTFVYHQIILGYIEFVRNLGFEQMLIWACPPMQGDDYILYCHPSKQKVPRSDRLRMWYLDMLRRAREEGTVVAVSSLYDSYFEGGRDHRMERCSAAFMPYLEGDFWPGEAENVLGALGPEGSGKGSKGGGGGRKGAAKAKRYGPEGGSLDQQLMAKLAETLGGNMKDDFMVVHMREPCSLCRAYVAGNVLHRYTPPPGAPPPAARPPPGRSFEGIRLDGPGGAGAGGGGGGNQVANFQICGACFSGEMGRLSAGARTRLPDRVALSDLVAVHVQELPILRDPDPDMESEIFETRQAFLSLCQGNHYQFDSLRRAKHSSMMVLYHLHNPNAPAWVSTCNKCSQEIETGTGFRCTVCPDFDMCANCRNAGVQHEHPLVAHHGNLGRIDETRTRLTEQERAERAAQLQKTLQLLVHACSCNNPACGSNSCRKVRQLFQHAVACQLKVTGGCQLCKKMWCLLNLHARSCTATGCPVPRCRELRDMRRRQALRQDKARRVAYQQMLRAQAGGGSGYGE